MSSRRSISASRERRRVSLVIRSSARSMVSIPRRAQEKPSLRIWDRKGLRPGPYFRTVSSMHQPTSRRITSVGRARWS